MNNKATDREALEAQLEQLAKSGAIDDTLTLVIEHYGREFFGYLMSMVRNEDIAKDLFQEFSIDVWRQLPAFAWRCPLRIWAYRLLRGQLARHYRSPTQKKERRLETSEQNRLAAQWTRTATLEWRKTESRERLWEACASLDDADRQLLMLRLNQRLSWKDIARVLEDDDADAEHLKKSAAACRKRFERTKGKLRDVMADLADA